VPFSDWVMSLLFFMQIFSQGMSKHLELDVLRCAFITVRNEDISLKFTPDLRSQSFPQLIMAKLRSTAPAARNSGKTWSLRELKVYKAVVKQVQSNRKASVKLSYKFQLWKLSERNANPRVVGRPCTFPGIYRKTRLWYFLLAHPYFGTYVQGWRKAGLQNGVAETNEMKHNNFLHIQKFQTSPTSMESWE
jgi:hypothetical protein